jgi:peptide/nickel transport system permease protein
VAGRPSTPNRGVTIAKGRDEYRDYPHLVFTRALALFLTVLSLNTVGDWLRGKVQVRESNL